MESSQESLFTDETKGGIEVIYSKFIDQRRMDYKSLFGGFDHLKVITFSYGLGFVETVSDMFEDVEIIIGSMNTVRPDIVEVAMHQKLEMKRLSKRKRLVERVKDGSVRIYGDDVSRLYRRLDEAHKFLAQLNSGGTGGGADYENAEPWQKAIHDNALTTPSPGAGWCAMWVSQVYYNAGFGYIGGNADDMYYRYCHSSDRSELKVGMLIAVDKYVTNGYPYAGYSPDGRKLSYHVGIYMGNGMVRDNIGSITDTPLDQWIATYGSPMLSIVKSSPVSLPTISASSSCV